MFSQDPSLVNVLRLSIPDSWTCGWYQSRMSGKTGLDRVEVYIDMLQRLDIYGWTWSALSHHLHPDPSPAPAHDCAQTFEKICDLNLYLHFMFSPAPVLKIMRYMSLSIGVISWNKQCYVEWKIAHSSLNLFLKQFWKSMHTMTWTQVDWSCPSCCSFSSSPWSCPAGKWWC